MMDCRTAISLMHEYLDGDLAQDKAIELNGHLRGCASCTQHYNQLQRTTAMIQAIPNMKAPEDLTNRIMNALPQQRKRKNRMMQWVQKHPAFTAAAVFALVMLSSFMSMWNEENELIVKGADLSQVVIQGDTVIVPEGTKVAGNLTVEHGKAVVNGEVEGDVIVIDGSLNMASTAHIAGQVTTVNQALDWVWYKLGEAYSYVTE